MSNNEWSFLGSVNCTLEIFLHGLIKNMKILTKKLYWQDAVQVMYQIRGQVKTKTRTQIVDQLKDPVMWQMSEHIWWELDNKVFS